VRSKLYLDEDSAERALMEALRVRGIYVASPHEHELLEADDLSQLKWCAQHQYVLVTHNAGDFYGLHTDFLANGKSHAGIIII
jgi:hypothetical protein